MSPSQLDYPRFPIAYNPPPAPRPGYLIGLDRQKRDLYLLGGGKSVSKKTKVCLHVHSPFHLPPILNTLAPFYAIYDTNRNNRNMVDHISPIYILPILSLYKTRIYIKGGRNRGIIIYTYLYYIIYILKIMLPGLFEVSDMTLILHDFLSLLLRVGYINFAERGSEGHFSGDPPTSPRGM